MRVIGGEFIMETGATFSDIPAAMEVRVIPITKLFLDGESVKHCGVIIASEKEGELAAIKHAEAASYSVSPIHWVLDVPVNDGPNITFRSTDIVKTIKNEKKDAGGFVFKSNMEATDEVKDQKLTFKLPVVKHQQFKWNLEFQNFEELCYEMIDFGERKSSNKRIVERMELNAKECAELVFESMLEPGYCRAYIKFVYMNKELSRKEMKQAILSIDNMPNFVRSIFPKWMDAQAWMLISVFRFLRDHVCKNSTCGGFSLLKCKDCKRTHYCTVECQRKDWEEHQKVCEKLTYHDCRDEIEKYLEISIGKKPISFKIFSKTLNQRLFEFFYGALQSKFFLQNQLFVDFFYKQFDLKINSKISSLLKRPNATKSWYTVRNQFEEAYAGHQVNLLTRSKLPTDGRITNKRYTK